MRRLDHLTTSTSEPKALFLQEFTKLTASELVITLSLGKLVLLAQRQELGLIRLQD